MLKPRKDFHGMFPGFGQFDDRTPAHLYQFEGALLENHTKQYAVIRPVYSMHFRQIVSPLQLLATLRAGDSTWPGSYPLFFITSDGTALSFQSVRQELRSVLWSIRHNVSDGWKVVGCDVNYEDSDLYCAHSNEPIPCAYPDD